MSWSDEVVALNAEMYAVFCDTHAVWRQNGIETDLLIVNEIEADEIKRQDFGITNLEQKIIACPTSYITGMNRKDTIAIEGIDHTVLKIVSDTTGWTEIVVERIR